MIDLLIYGRTSAWDMHSITIKCNLCRLIILNIFHIHINLQSAEPYWFCTLFR